MANKKTVRYIGDDLWEAAYIIEKGYSMKIHYDSKRSPDTKTMVGEITSLYTESGELCIKAERMDGQVIIAKSDHHLYSSGSDFPDNGRILQIEVFA